MCTFDLQHLGKQLQTLHRSFFSLPSNITVAKDPGFFLIPGMIYIILAMLQSLVLLESPGMCLKCAMPLNDANQKGPVTKLNYCHSAEGQLLSLMSNHAICSEIHPLNLGVPVAH